MRSHVVVFMLCVAILSVGSSAHALGIFGGRAGVSVAEVSTDVDQTFSEDNRTGFAGSLFSQLGVGFVLLQPEASYIQKGTKDFQIDYFELAALLKAGLPASVVLSPHAFAGIGADWIIDSSSEFGVDTKNTDWSAIFGLDLMVNLKKCIVIADARYSVGLTDIQQASDAVGDFKNRAWLLSAGLGFNF